MRRQAGYEGGKDDEAQRAKLSRALAANLKAGLVGADADTLGIEELISQARYHAPPRQLPARL